MESGSPSESDDGTAAQTKQMRSRRAWVVIVGLAVALLVVPGALLVLPAVRSAIAAAGLPFRDAYLVLPLVPALGLGLLGVWSALRSGGA